MRANRNPYRRIPIHLAVALLAATLFAFGRAQPAVAGAPFLEERALPSGGLLLGRPEWLEQLAAAVETTPVPAGAVLADGEAVAGQPEVLAGLRGRYQAGDALFFLGGDPAAARQLGFPSVVGTPEVTLAALREGVGGRETGPIPFEAATVWGIRRGEGRPAAFSGQAPRTELPRLLAAAFRWAEEHAAPAEAVTVAPWSPLPTVVLQWTDARLAIRILLEPYKLNEADPAVDWYRVDASSETTVLDFRAGGDRCGYYVTDRRLSFNVSRADDDFHRGFLHSYGPPSRVHTGVITFSLGEGLATTSPDSPAYSRAWSSEGVDVFDTGYSTPGQVAAWRERFEGPNYRGYPHYLPPALAAVGRFVSEPSLIVRVDGGRSPAPNGVRIAVRQAIDLEADDLRLTSLVPPQVYPQAAILYYAAAQDLSLDFRQPPAAATLIVDSTPRGADVFLDGAATGQTTPATIPGVTLGNHVLRLAKAGYAEWVETIAVQHDPETVSRTLAALPGGLTLRSAPEGARITLDGRDSGRFTPATFTGLAAGAHTYRLTKPGYLPVPGAVSVPPGLTVAVDVNLNLRRYSWGFSVASTLDTAADVLVNLPGLGRLQDTGNPQAGRGLDLYADGNAGLEYSILRPDFDAEGTAGSGGVSVELPHYRSFQVQLSQPDQGTSAWSFLRENDGVVVGLFAATGAGATGNAATKPAVLTSRVARLSGSARDTLLEIPGLGGVRDTGNPSKPRKLEIYSDGPQVVEWSLRYEATYRQGEVRPGKAVEIDFPHYTAFELQIARPFARQSGILFAKENDNRLVGVAAAGGGSGPAAYAGSLDLDLTDGLRQTLIEFPGLGGVREAAGPAGTTMLELYSSGEVVELTLQSGKTQLRKEVAAGAAPVLIPFPHGQPFKLSIARPFRADTLGWGWLFLKESGGHLVGHVLVSR